jgi:heme-degrading monooxygenase HmoA
MRRSTELFPAVSSFLSLEPAAVLLPAFFCPEAIMIARIWHGYTRPEHADAYESMLKPEVLPGISKVKGYRGSYLLRRNTGAEIEFITIMLWDSIDAIRAVTGPDYETAVIPAERRKYLSRCDPKSQHYEIAATHTPPDGGTGR